MRFTKYLTLLFKKHLNTDFLIPLDKSIYTVFGVSLLNTLFGASEDTHLLLAILFVQFSFPKENYKAQSNIANKNNFAQ